jgi:hypothetical protein
MVAGPRATAWDRCARATIVQKPVVAGPMNMLPDRPVLPPAQSRPFHRVRVPVVVGAHVDTGPCLPKLLRGDAVGSTTSISGHEFTASKAMERP